jgi:hypothetical protein
VDEAFGCLKRKIGSNLTGFYAYPRILALDMVFTLSRSREMKSFVAMLILLAGMLISLSRTAVSEASLTPEEMADASDDLVDCASLL